MEPCNEILKNKDLSARGIIQKSNVTHLCTTDDPIDSLEHHIRIAKDKSFETQVLPAFRPDEAINIDKAQYLDYLDKLSQVSNIKIDSFESLCEALKIVWNSFDSLGVKPPIMDLNLLCIILHQMMK